MRRHIAKNMQTRSHALRNGIQAYNTAAAAMDPPRPPLEWETVSHYQLLQEFELLNDTRADVREQRWAEPAVRETIRLARRLARAQEEIQSVSTEARRIHTSIRDENALFTAILDRLSRDGDPMHAAVLEHATRRRAANAHVLASLKKLYEHPEFSGNPTPGVRKGGAPVAPLIDRSDLEEMLMSEAKAMEAEEKHGETHEYEDDDVQDEITAVTDYIGTLGS